MSDVGSTKPQKHPCRVGPTRPKPHCAASQPSFKRINRHLQPRSSSNSSSRAPTHPPAASPPAATAPGLAPAHHHLPSTAIPSAACWTLLVTSMCAWAGWRRTCRACKGARVGWRLSSHLPAEPCPRPDWCLTNHNPSRRQLPRPHRNHPPHYSTSLQSRHHRSSNNSSSSAHKKRSSSTTGRHNRASSNSLNCNCRVGPLKGWDQAVIGRTEGPLVVAYPLPELVAPSVQREGWETPCP